MKTLKEIYYNHKIPFARKTQVYQNINRNKIIKNIKVKL